MKRQTILLVDGDKRRGGQIEQSLTRLGLNVFRTSRIHEGQNLFRVLKPSCLVVALEDEGMMFYQYIHENTPRRDFNCILLGSADTKVLHSDDQLVDLSFSFEALTEGLFKALKSLPSMAALGQAPSPDPVEMMAPPNSVVMGRAESASNTKPSSTPKPPVVKTVERDWKGTLEQLDIARLLSVLMQRRVTGKLSLSKGRELRHIWFDNGGIIGANTNAIAPHFFKVLSEITGLDSSALLKHKEQLLKSHPGDQLFAMKMIPQSNISSANRYYVEEILFSCFLWVQGDFCFYPQENQFTGTPVKVELPPVLLRGVREGYHLQRINHLLGDMSRIPFWTASRRPKLHFTLQAQENQIIEQIDGLKSILELQRTLRVDSVFVSALVYVFTILGHLSLQENEVAQRSFPEQNQTSFYRSETESFVKDSVRSSSTQSPQAKSVSGHVGTNTTFVQNDTLANLSHPRGGRVRAPTMNFRRPIMPSRSAPVAESNQGGALQTQHETAEQQALLAVIEQKYKQAMSDNYFQILEISEAATELDVRRAYQKLKQSFSETHFSSLTSEKTRAYLSEVQLVIQESYEVLSDPPVREHYRKQMDQW